MKDTKAMAVTFAVGLAAAYAFSILSVKFGPFPGIAHKATGLK